MKIEFLGAAGTVTGSKTLLTSGKRKILVDCGLFQGLKNLRLKNWERFPFDPRKIESVLLTHAHLDHSGALPILTRAGFKGRIYSTAPTTELTEIILKDSARLQEEDAAFLNRHHLSKHSPARPLYDMDDVARTLTRFENVPKNRWRDTSDRIRFRMIPSGHILGSSFVEIASGASRIVFSGDLGRSNPLLYPPPSRIREADYLVLESTYGDRTHHGSSPLQQLARIVNDTRARGGQLLIPSFAVGRIQELLYLLWQLRKRRKIPAIPVYLDSPMGEAATRIFSENPDWHRLNPDEVDGLIRTATILTHQRQSIELMRSDSPAIIIAGSGMLSGGRILHHLEAKLSDPKHTVLLVGYQAAGTRGRLLKDGIGELKIHGRYVPVQAHIEEISDLSGHADQTEILAWLRGFVRPPRKVFLNHGEPQALDALRVKIRDTLGWNCVVVNEGESHDLETQ